MISTVDQKGDHEKESSSVPYSIPESCSQETNESYTAAEFINSQLQLEADAHEALPFKFDNCTKNLGSLRQSIFSCLTCNPIPTNPLEPYRAAGICYSCSIQCHGDHKLVELFCKRNFECDCGTTRLPESSPCKLRINPDTAEKGGICLDKPSATNVYNQNFRNRFCCCECDYDAENEDGTMYQCLGLGTANDGGCGEDWWHASCIVGLEPNWFQISTNKNNLQSPKNMRQKTTDFNIDQDAQRSQNTGDRTFEPLNTQTPAHNNDMGHPIPSGFPAEDSFDGFICYKCVEAFPWIKRYAGAPGFLPPVYRQDTSKIFKSEINQEFQRSNTRKRNVNEIQTSVSSIPSNLVKKNKINDSSAIDASETSDTSIVESTKSSTLCKLEDLPPAQTGQFSLFYMEDFRLNLCRCDKCFPYIQAHPQLLELEETYEPSVSNDSYEEPNSTIGSSSLYDRGESALQNIDRVKAIEGVMAYNHLKDKLKPFFQEFAESGRTISAEDIKAHFAKIRGDDEAIFEAGEAAKINSGRHEQSGF
ncbi:hypothetical protein OnM2_062009 [Erysiphe neolycopersici]|uniref:UBR-type domain-containing protein n=1 Tax=Erysiphe neolycopersici TaxID=212602 RepID=A0A420HP38_9PEZI|nr:hypothetical protein OnM2_062009 [Erysiphe neolycopersici]